MLFNSFEFLIFAPLALLGHALLRGWAWRAFLVVMSYIFYGWANPIYCTLLAASTFLDFFVGLRVAQARTPRTRKLWLCASMVGNLGLLGSFKYLGFFAQSLNELAALAGVSLHLAPPHLELPVGISFYTFQTMSYTIDVYRGLLAPTRSFSTFALYVAFFPQLVAGPIERATHLLNQLYDRRPRTSDDILCGMTRIWWGLMKKILLADWLGMYVNQVYNNLGDMHPSDVLLATYAFAFQIYFDFSAYSDIAIGLARTMGIELRENFRWPFIARNTSEFWRRWHISFSTWLRDYLFIPLGGSRHGAARTALNVLIVMFLGGLWHGADKKYIVWGLWIGVGLGTYQVYALWRQKRVDERTPHRWRDIPAILLTFHVILLSWVLFRANTMTDAIAILRDFVNPASSWTFQTLPHDIIRTVALIALAAAAHFFRGLNWDRPLRQIRSAPLMGLLWGTIIVAIVLLAPPIGERFIYFQF